MDRDKLFQIGAIALACFVSWAAFHTIDAAPMTRGEVADWVQGVGTVAAVAIATWAGTLPSRDEARRTRERRASFARAVLRASEHTYELLNLLIITAETRNGSVFGMAIKWHDDLGAPVPLERLLGEPLSTWPSPDLYIMALEFRNIAEAVRKGASAVIGAAEGDDREAEFRSVALSRHRATAAYESLRGQCLTLAQ